jgi:outer membrane protein assembly factor BamA
MTVRCSVAVVLLLLTLLLPTQSADGYEVDTTRVRKPVKEHLNLGQKLLHVPEYAVRLPFLTVEGAVSVVTNEVVLTETVGRIKSMFGRVDRVWGFYPVVGYGSNSGLKGGLSFTSKQVFTKGERLKIKATYSTHDYQRYSLRYGAPNKFGVFRRPYIAASYRKRPWESFYGLGNDSDDDDEVAFTLEKGEFGFGWHHNLFSTTRLNIDNSYRILNIYDGEDPSVEGDLTAIADSLDLTPYDMRSTRIWSFGIGVSHDWRNHEGQPSAGGWETVGISYNKGGGRSGDLEYIVSWLDLRHYLNVFKKRLLVLRVMAEAVDPMGDAPDVPFYLRRYLGGEEDLRGYRTRRFVDNDVALASIEYRWPVWLRLDAFLFLDEARVFRSVTHDFSLNNWRYSAGGGLRVWNNDGVILSTTIAFGDEGMRFYLQLGDAF